jgi:hypothetical protein
MVLGGKRAVIERRKNETFCGLRVVADTGAQRVIIFHDLAATLGL